MITELLLHAHLAELHRHVHTAARSAEARRGGSRLAPTDARARIRQEAVHAPGAWCWLLDRLPGRAQQHAAA